MSELSNFKVAIIVSDGFEETELTEPLRALRKMGAEIDLLSPDKTLVQGFRGTEKGIRMDADGTFGEGLPPDPQQYDALVLPGGALNADRLRNDKRVLSFIQSIEMDGKPIAFICHAPWILISAGLIASRTLTGYPSIREDIRNAGGNFVNQTVVVDNNWVSSRSPEDLPSFCREMIHLFSQFASQKKLQQSEAA